MSKDLYHYAPVKNTIAKDGLQSTAFQHGIDPAAPDLSGWRKYKETAKAAGYPATREGVLHWLDASTPGFRRSYAVSAFTEPIPHDARITGKLKSFRDEKVLFRICPAAELIAAGVVARIYRPGKHRVVKDTSDKPLDWYVKPEQNNWLPRIPSYMLETTDGHIPPEYVEEVKQNKTAANDSIHRLSTDFANGPKWHDEDTDREFASHMNEFAMEGTYKNLVDAAIIKNIKARIAFREANRLLSQYDKETGTSYKDILASRLAKFRQYEHIPFPSDRRYKVHGAILGCLTGPLKYKVTEDLPDDPWKAVIESDGNLTEAEVADWHRVHQADPDRKGVPYYFVVDDTKDNKSYVWYTDDDRWMPINNKKEQDAAVKAGKAKGLVPEQLDFAPKQTKKASDEVYLGTTNPGKSLREQGVLKKANKEIKKTMKYIDALRMVKQARTPEGEVPIPEKQQFDPEEGLNRDLTKHYASLLAAAMKRAGAPKEFVQRADQFVSPVYTYALGRAVRIHPDLLNRLHPKDREQLSGWNFHSRNITPKLIEDAVKAYDYGKRRYVPLNDADQWATGPKLELINKGQ